MIKIITTKMPSMPCAIIFNEIKKFSNIVVSMILILNFNFNFKLNAFKRVSSEAQCLVNIQRDVNAVKV